MGAYVGRTWLALLMRENASSVHPSIRRNVEMDSDDDKKIWQGNNNLWVDNNKIGRTID